MIASRVPLRVPASFLAGSCCLLPTAMRGPWLSERRQEIESLTPAEQRVCELLLAGFSNKEIATELRRAESTIKNQVAAVLRKHSVPSRARLIALFR